MVLHPLDSLTCSWLSKGIEHILCRIHVCNLLQQRNSSLLSRQHKGRYKQVTGLDTSIHTPWQCS